MDEFLDSLGNLLKILLPIIVPILAALVAVIKIQHSSNKSLKKEIQDLNAEKTLILNKYITDLKDVITRYTNVIKDLQDIVETSFDLEKENATLLRDMVVAIKLLDEQHKLLDRNTESVPVALSKIKSGIEKIDNQRIKDDLTVLAEKLDNIYNMLRGNDEQ